MKKLVDLIAEKTAEAFESAGYSRSYARVSVSSRPDLCEYQCNGALAAKKEYQKAPIRIAEDVAARLQGSPVFAKAEAVMPGFINLTLAPAFVSEYLQNMAEDPEHSVEKTASPEKIIIDYGGPNVAKPLHVGHLRSAIIGESIKRMGRRLGNTKYMQFIN